MQEPIAVLWGALIGGLVGSAAATWGLYLLQRRTERLEARAGRKQIAQLIRNVAAELSAKSAEDLHNADWSTLTRLEDRALAVESIRSLGDRLDRVIGLLPRFKALHAAAVSRAEAGLIDGITGTFANSRLRDAVVLQAATVANQIDECAA